MKTLFNGTEEQLKNDLDNYKTMENLISLHFQQITDMNSHYIWSCMHNLLSLARKYEEPIEYRSAHDTSSEFYDLYIKCKDGFIKEMIILYVTYHLPEFIYIGEEITK